MEGAGGRPRESRTVVTGSLSHERIRGKRRNPGCRSGVAGALGLDQPLPAGDQHRGHLLHRPTGGQPRQVALSGVLYTLGRTIAYVLLGALLVASVLSVPQLSMFLQNYMNKVLGPILVVVAMFLLDLIHLNTPGSGMSEGLQKRVERSASWGLCRSGLCSALRSAPSRPHCSSEA